MAVSWLNRMRALFHYWLSREKTLAARLKRIEGSRMAAGAEASLDSAAEHLKQAGRLNPDRFSRQGGK